MRLVNLIVTPVIIFACLGFGLIRSNEIALFASIGIAFIAYLIDRHLRLNY